MSKLEFFCNRPTLVALIQFGLDTSSANSGGSSEVATMACEEIETTKRLRKQDAADAFVKGLLGYGKGRVVFKLSMDVDSVTVFLNQEDGTQFAMFIQESFILDLRVCHLLSFICFHRLLLGNFLQFSLTWELYLFECSPTFDVVIHYIFVNIFNFILVMN